MFKFRDEICLKSVEGKGVGAVTGCYPSEGEGRSMEGRLFSL